VNGNGYDHADEQAKALTEEELGRLLDEVPGKWRLFFELLAQTGMRIGEAVAVRWSNVDFDRRQLKVERRFYRGGFATPKSKYGRRTIPLSRRLAAELEARWLLEDNPEALVFRSAAGTVVDGGNLPRAC
jgi:integrase